MPRHIQKKSSSKKISKGTADAAVLRRSSRQQHALDTALVFFTGWLPGLLSLPSYLGGDDSGEFITSTFFLGLQHMPGYPWHPLLNWPASRMAFSEPGFGVALSSMLLFPAMVTLAFFVLAPRERSLQKGLLGAGAVLLLLCERLVFYQAYTDVYGGPFLFCGLLGLWWWRGQGKSPLLWVFLAALAGAAHPSGFVAGLVLATVVVGRSIGDDKKPRWASLLGLALWMGLLVLSLEWYLPLRSASGLWFLWSDAASWPGYLAYKTTGPSLQTRLPQAGAVLGHLWLALRDWGAMGGVLLIGVTVQKWSPQNRRLKSLGLIGMAGAYLLLMAVLIRLPDTPFGLLTYAQYYGPVAAFGLVVWLASRPALPVAGATVALMGLFAAQGVWAMWGYRSVDRVQQRLFERTLEPLPFESLYLSHLTNEHFLLLYEHGLKRNRPDIEIKDVLGRIWEGGRLEPLRRREGAEAVFLSVVTGVQKQVERRFVASGLDWFSLSLSPRQGQGNHASLLPFPEDWRKPWGALWLFPPPPFSLPPPTRRFLEKGPWPQEGQFQRDHLGKEALAHYFGNLAVLSDQKSRRAALEKRALGLGWQSPLVLSLLGQLALKNRHEEDARERLERALRLDPDEPSHRIELAKLELLSGHYEEAQTLLQSRLAQIKNHPGGGGLYGLILLKLADEAVARKEFDKALKMYAAARPLLPETPEFYYRTGEAWFGAGEFRKARRALDKALRLADEREKVSGQKMDETLKSTVLARLGQAAAKVGDDETAARAFEQLQPLRPYDDNLLKVLVQLYEKMKQPQSAIRTLEKLISVTPDETVRAAARERINLLKSGKPIPAKTAGTTDPLLRLLKKQSPKGKKSWF